MCATVVCIITQPCDLLDSIMLVGVTAASNLYCTFGCPQTSATMGPKYINQSKINMGGVGGWVIDESE